MPVRKSFFKLNITYTLSLPGIIIIVITVVSLYELHTQCSVREDVLHLQ